MKNIIATIPKSRFKTWELAERVVKRCDGEKWFWTLRMPRKPKNDPIGSLCYMVYNDQIRGYFDIIDVDEAKNWEWHQERQQEGFVLVLANWHPVFGLPEMAGFQGWRYTALRP
ncbi:hypothetical protein GO755_29725 [Spirosoma sp. HMF4905]|uniref:Uncharacterized protein n=1 Tax=Spirosoma arboris TaxID=2682092 RepID=A0A7K1SKB5_9BACT|nr:DUF1489 family protein [Spirosoma arboris]MVM34247.1 hypothetical protein [Spirosoma arboris]